ILEIVTWAFKLIINTHPALLPTTIVLSTPDPFRMRFLLLIVTFSIYLPGASIIVSPKVAFSTATVIVRQGAVGERHILLSLPVGDTYQIGLSITETVVVTVAVVTEFLAMTVAV